jgi:hypothetical protein
MGSGKIYIGDDPKIKKQLIKGTSANSLGISKYLMQRLKPSEQTVKAKPWVSQKRYERLPKNVQQGLANKWGRQLTGTLLKRINKGWKPVKQVLPTVGRTIGAASGWGTLIAGASLLAQTKKAKQFRQDPTYRKATIKKLFHTKNTFPIFTISPSVARFFEETGHKPSKKYPPKIRDPYWGKN